MEPPEAPPRSATPQEDAQDSVYTHPHGYRLFLQKDTDQEQQRKGTGGTVVGDQAPTSQILSEGSHRAARPLNECSNGKCCPQGRSLATRPWVFLGAGHVAPLPDMCQNSRLPRRKAGFRINPRCQLRASLASRPFLI